ncbi:MAG: KEOPS complex subunit Pcc1 [Halolamina sp.]
MSEARREAVVSTTHEDAATVAAALAPDNTDAMTTRVDGATVRTIVVRDRTGGLAATVDDYVVNLTVADAVAETARDTDNL